MAPVPYRIDARILVVDDEAPVHLILREILERSGARVHTADSGIEAVKLLDSAHSVGEPFELVITDLALGGEFDGFHIARHARGRTPSVRVLACTGRSSDPVTISPVEFGFDGCLEKPFYIQDVLDKVSELVGSR